MSQNWETLAHVFKENHQLLWLLPGRDYYCLWLGFASCDIRQSHVAIRKAQGTLAAYQIY